MKSFISFTLIGLSMCLWGGSSSAGEVPQEYRKTIRKGLDWLAKNQSKDGHWAATGGQYPVAMTALAGMAMLMEGSTIRQGKYATNLQLATDWLMENARPNGLIASSNDPADRSFQRYMYGHGFSTMFLACVYGDEEDAKRRRELKEILIKAVQYIGSAQSSKGGWYYMSAKESGDNDEGSVTITQVQALRACRNAGIPVPKKFITKAYNYLKDCTSPNGSIYYSYRVRRETIAITAAGIACLFNAGEYDDPMAKKWFKYCRQKISLSSPGNSRFGYHDEYTHYYFSQCVYILGEDGWEKLFGETPPSQRLTWSKYRESFFKRLVSTQNSDGSWPGRIGTVYVTAIYCTIMQLDRETLPLYMR